MTILDWTRYASDQIRWAETLLVRAAHIHGPDSEALYAESAATLADVSALIQSVTDPEPGPHRAELPE